MIIYIGYYLTIGCWATLAFWWRRKCGPIELQVALLSILLWPLFIVLFLHYLVKKQPTGKPK